MNKKSLEKLERELDVYVEELTTGMGRAERRAAMGHYVTGLLLDGERKSIEPIAARLVDRPDEVQAMRQRLQQCVVVAEWAETEIFNRIALKLDRELPSVEALIIDDTGFEKKGAHSVGVQRQYSGTTGRTENCQIATTLHLASEVASGCIGARLYLPESWVLDADRRKKAGIPEEVEFSEKWRLALGLIDQALAVGVERHVVLADAGYGDTGEFRRELDARQLEYVVAVAGKHVIWRPEAKPVRTPIRNGKNIGYVDKAHPPVTIADYASTLSYRTITWREGSRGTQRSRFAAIRIRSASSHARGQPPGELTWLLCWWPHNEPKPCKFWLSNLPADTSMKRLVHLAKLRWRVERDYQEMKGELGLDHFEGRTWRGFHHHIALCAAAHAFLALRRALFPPEPDQVDLADGASASPTSTSTSTAVLPAVRAPNRQPQPRVGLLTHVIE